MRQTDITKWSGILVYLECYKGKIHKVSLEMIAEAVRLAETSREEVYVLGIGAEMEKVQEELIGYPIKTAYLYEAKDEYTPLLYEEITVSAIRKLLPSIVLIGGTYEGRALAPRLAVAFETGLTADCTTLEIEAEGKLVQTRPAFGGNVMASIVTDVCRPQFATVRPGIMRPMEKKQEYTPHVICEKVEGKPDNVQILETIMSKVEEDITNQDILVVAGRGVKKKEDLDMPRELSELMGGKLASSSALVEKGWMSPKEQIGLSGHTVSPSLMITCGVSGTVQFMAGMKHTKNIIAINTDEQARIFEIAHYPVCGDLYEIVPEMIELLKSRKGDEGSAT